MAREVSRKVSEKHSNADILVEIIEFDDKSTVLKMTKLKPEPCAPTQADIDATVERFMQIPHIRSVSVIQETDHGEKTTLAKATKH